MAKATTIKIKLESTADTGFFYVTKKNSRTMTDKMVKRNMTPLPRSTWSSRKPRSSRFSRQPVSYPRCQITRIAKPRFQAGLFVCRTQDAGGLS